MAGSGFGGPKRLEITLRSVGNQAEKKIVVTDLMPPSGRYASYSVSGREWKVFHRELHRAPSTVWSSSYMLLRIDSHLGGSGGSTTDHFAEANQETAWATL